MLLNEADLDYRALLQAFVDFGVGFGMLLMVLDRFHVADAHLLQASYRRLLELS